MSSISRTRWLSEVGVHFVEFFLSIICSKCTYIVKHSMAIPLILLPFPKNMKLVLKKIFRWIPKIDARNEKYING